MNFARNLKKTQVTQNTNKQRSELTMFVKLRIGGKSSASEEIKSLQRDYSAILFQTEWIVIDWLKVVEPTAKRLRIPWKSREISRNSR